MKTTRSSIALASRVGNDGVVSDSGSAGAKSVRSIGRSDTSRKKLIKSKSQIKNMQLGNKNNTNKPKFLTYEAREAFNRLSQAFIKAPIFQYFNPECYIRIKTDISDYSIREVLSQLTSNQLILDDIIFFQIKS